MVIASTTTAARDTPDVFDPGVFDPDVFDPDPGVGAPDAGEGGRNVDTGASLTCFAVLPGHPRPVV